MKKQWLVGFSLLLFMGAAAFIGCNNGNFPTNASDPNNNSAIPKPPETELTTSIAFTGLATNGDNAFAFTVLQTLSMATTIYITDSAWDANINSLVGGKNVIFTPSQNLPPGAQVLIAEGQAAASLIYHAQITGIAGTINTDGAPGDQMGMSKNASDLIAYAISSGGATVFLTALNGNSSHPFLTSGPASKGNSYVPPGLQLGVNAIDLFSLQGENVVFGNCGAAQFPAQITATQLLAVLINPSNWIVAPGGSSTVAFPGTGAQMCDITAVIQPAAIAVPTPYYTPLPTATPLPCGYPGPTCTPTPAVAFTPGPVVPGSIAFTGLTFNGNSQISFVSTDQITAGTVLYFTNYTYDPTQGCLVDESLSADTAASVTLENLYDPTANNGQGGFVPTLVSLNTGLAATTIVEGIISYTTGSSGLAPYHQVVIGNTGNSTNILQGGTVANVQGAGGAAWLVQNHDGVGHKVFAFTTTASTPSMTTINNSNTTWLAGIIFGQDSWTSSGSIPLGNFWDSYLPPGLNSVTSTDLSGLWTTDNLIQYNNAADQNDNAVLDVCQNTLSGIVNPANWVADGNKSKTKVSLSPPIAVTGCPAGGAGYTGALP